MCGGSRTHLPPAREDRLRVPSHQKPPQNCPASRPRSTSTASMTSTKLVRALHQTPLHPLPCCATVGQWPSNPIAERDRDQPHLLCPPTRAARAALRGRTIIWHRQTPDRPRRPGLLDWTLPRACNPSLSLPVASSILEYIPAVDFPWILVLTVLY